MQYSHFLMLEGKIQQEVTVLDDCGWDGSFSSMEQQHCGLRPFSLYTRFQTAVFSFL